MTGYSLSSLASQYMAREGICCWPSDRQGMSCSKGLVPVGWQQPEAGLAGALHEWRERPSNRAGHLHGCTALGQLAVGSPLVSLALETGISHVHRHVHSGRMLQMPAAHLWSAMPFSHHTSRWRAEMPRLHISSRFGIMHSPASIGQIAVICCRSCRLSHLHTDLSISLRSKHLSRACACIDHLTVHATAL